MPVDIVVTGQITDLIIESVIAAWAENFPDQKKDFDDFCDQFRRDLVNKSGMAVGVSSRIKGDSMVMGHVPPAIYSYMNDRFDGFFHNETGAHQRFYKIYKKARAKRD